MASEEWKPVGSSSGATRREAEAEAVRVAGLPSGSSASGLSLTADQTSALLRSLLERTGVQFTDTLGRFVLRLALGLPAGAPPPDGLSPPQLARLLDEFSFRPVLQARHPRVCAVLGGGAFGTAMAVALARKGHEVRVLFRECEGEHARAVNETRRNTMCFPDEELPAGVRAYTSAGPALEGAEYVVLAIPVQFSAAVLRGVSALIPDATPVVCVSKGIEASTGLLMSEVVPAALGRPKHPVAFLAGPSFAIGMLRGHPTTVTAASTYPKLARAIQVLLSSGSFRVLTTDDVMGVEVGSALKNVLAIGCGIVGGLGMSANTQTAIVTRGWADIRRLALRRGARAATLTGMAGIGDVMLTCFGGESRNQRFGRLLAEHGSVERALEAAGGVVEGLPTAAAAEDMGAREGVQLPVISAIAECVRGGISPRDMVSYVFSLPLGPEEEGGAKRKADAEGDGGGGKRKAAL